MLDPSGTINYERRGSGPPLVLIHGLGGSQLIWNPVLELLGGSRDVITVDMPGFGSSPVLGGAVAPSAANLGSAISDFLLGLGINRPHLAGNSLGGWAALEMAKAGRAASVCAISPAGLWTARLGPRGLDARALARRFTPLLGPLISAPQTRRALLATTLARPENLTAAEARALILDWLHSPGYDAANAEMRGHVFEDPELITVPTTIARGDRDRLVGRPRPERMPPQSRFIVLEGCGHTPTWDAPERVAEVLLAASAVAAPAAAGRS